MRRQRLRVCLAELFESHLLKLQRPHKLRASARSVPVVLRAMLHVFHPTAPAQSRFARTLGLRSCPIPTPPTTPNHHRRIRFAILPARTPRKRHLRLRGRHNRLKQLPRMYQATWTSWTRWEWGEGLRWRANKLGANNRSLWPIRHHKRQLQPLHEYQLEGIKAA